MSDKMKTREPGEDGSTQGQIQTPMCSENVANKGGEKTHSFKKAVGSIDKSGKANTIEGPGMTGNWDTQISIKGSNKKY
jgi:hypothetical protein